MKTPTFKINYFQTPRDKLKYEIVNAVYLLLFIIPLVTVIIFEISGFIFLLSVIFFLVPIFLVLFNRIMPNANLVIKEKELIIHSEKNKINILFSEISSIEILKTNEINETYVCFYVKKENNDLIKFTVDKFYFLPAKIRSRKIINELNKHSVMQPKIKVRK